MHPSNGSRIDMYPYFRVAVLLRIYSMGGLLVSVCFELAELMPLCLLFRIRNTMCCNIISVEVRSNYGITPITFTDQGTITKKIQARPCRIVLFEGRTRENICENLEQSAFFINTFREATLLVSIGLRKNSQVGRSG